MLSVIVYACLFTNIMAAFFLNTKSDLSTLSSVYRSDDTESRIHRLHGDNMVFGRDSKAIRERRLTDQGWLMPMNSPPGVWHPKWPYNIHIGQCKYCNLNFVKILNKV